MTQEDLFARLGIKKPPSNPAATLHAGGSIPLRPIIPGGGNTGTLQRQWESFHRANPHILQAVLEIAMELRLAGMSKCNLSLIWERIRWLYMLRTTGAEGSEGDGTSYSLANAHRAFYARVAMMVEPQLRGFFVLRRQKVPFRPDWERIGIVPPDGWEEVLSLEPGEHNR